MFLRSQVPLRIHPSTVLRIPSISCLEIRKTCKGISGKTHTPPIPCIRVHPLSTFALPNEQLLQGTVSGQTPSPTLPSSEVLEDGLNSQDPSRSYPIKQLPPYSSGGKTEGDHVERVDIDLYLEGRRRRAFLRNLNPNLFVRLAEAAMKENLLTVANLIASDVVSLYIAQARNSGQHNRVNHYSKIACILLQLSSTKAKLSDKSILGLTSVALEQTSEVNSAQAGSEDEVSKESTFGLSMHALSGILETLISKPSGWSIENQEDFIRKIIQTVDWRIDFEFKSTAINRHMAAIQTRYKVIDANAFSRLTRAIFMFIQSILQYGDETLWSLAYDAFQVVVNRKLIQAESIRKEDEGLTHVPTIILSPIVQTCLERGWSFEAANILQSMEVVDKSHYEILVEDAVSGLLGERNRKRGITCSAELLKSAFERVPQIVISSECIQSIYRASYECGLRTLGAELYLHLRSRHPLQSDSAFPTGQALALFLNVFVKEQRNTLGAKLISRHIVETQPRIAKHSIATILMLLAEARMLDDVRLLWDIYVQGIDKKVITGNPRVMTTLVRSFVKADSKARSEGEFTDEMKKFESENLQDSGDPDDVASSSSSGEGEQHSREGSGAHAIPNEAAVFHAEHPGKAIPPHFNVNRGMIAAEVPLVGNNTKFSTRQPEPFPGTSEDDPGRLAPEGDGMLFARKVLAEFEAAMGQLRVANHFTINAIARGRALVGDYDGCLEALKAIIDRKEIPDIADINVVVDALAAQDPARAAMMVDNMLRLNVMPNSQTFGSIIQHALDHGDSALAGRCLAQIKSLGIEMLTPPTVVRLVQQSLAASLQEPDRGDARSSLWRTYFTMMSYDDPRKTFGTHVGMQAVKAALQANSGQLAFKFWDVLLKGRVDNDSPQQRRLRKHIAQRLRRNCGSGVLEQSVGHKYIDDLGL